MKCPHCGVEVTTVTGGATAKCAACGKSLAVREAGLVVQPPDLRPTFTEVLLAILGPLCHVAAAFVLVLACLSWHEPMAVAVVVSAIALCALGLIFQAFSHGLRYLRLTTNSLASFRARPLGDETDE